MKVRVRFFASIRERLKRGEGEYEVPAGGTVEDLWKALCAAHAPLAELRGSVSFAVNREYVEISHRLAEGDEVALIPPVSGGCRGVPNRT